VRRKNTKSLELDARLNKSALRVQKGLYESLYAAAKLLRLNKNLILERIDGGLAFDHNDATSSTQPLYQTMHP
jgi:hypothetical protein